MGLGSLPACRPWLPLALVTTLSVKGWGVVSSLRSVMPLANELCLPCYVALSTALLLPSGRIISDGLAGACV